MLLLKYIGMKNTKYGKSFYILIPIIVILFLIIPKNAKEKTITQIKKTPEVEKIKVIKIEPVIPQILLDISWCESRNDQSKRGKNYRYKIIDGRKIKYLWSTDIGRWQINDHYHKESAEKLGIDLYTEEGNRDFAILLYNSNGVRDWKASEACWSDIAVWRSKHNQPFYQ